MNACKLQFNEALFIFCLFHWKQALRRKMLEYHISKPVISELLNSEGLMNILTVIPVAEIESKGIPYTRRTFNENGNELKFDKFWKYFTNTWIVRYSPTDWNINGIIMNTKKTNVKRLIVLIIH